LGKKKEEKVKNRVIWFGLSVLLVISMLLASCGTKTTTTSSTASTTTQPTTVTTVSTTNTATTKTSTTTMTTTTTVSTSSTGHWWDSLGTPQYGGTLTFNISSNILTFDPYLGTNYTSENMGWMEQLFTDDWTLDPSVYNFQLNTRPTDYAGGCLATSWEFSDPSTLVMHLRQDVHWQNIAPVNGRPFTSADVVYHYNRLLGIGGGFTKVSPYYVGVPWTGCLSVTAIDKYAVSFHWNSSNPELILETAQQPSIVSCMEASEAVTQWVDLQDWHHAIGTGPFTLQDFVPDSSMTLEKNPSYWAFDERYPQNQLPYVDEVKILIIPNRDTALAAMRNGKIDVVGGPTVQQVAAMKVTHPEILCITTPGNPTDLDPRCDMAPWNNKNVRIALQKALNLPLIAQTFYNGYADPRPQTELSYYISGWGYPYDEWPQSLKDEYAYDPVAAKKLLTDAGYPTIHTYLVEINTLDQDLFQIVQSQLAAVGVTMDIQPMDSAALNSYLLTAHQNTGLASRGAKLGRIMAPTRPLTQYKVGDSVNYEMWNDPVYDAFYAAAVAATSVQGTKDVVKAANKYVAENHIDICLCTTYNYSFCQPWLKGFTGQSGAFGQLINTYLARFWIDQNVKKSYGH
jgi:peptide/nickel transport system substrate-binding protein